MSRYTKPPIAQPAGGGTFSGAAFVEYFNELVAALASGQFDIDLPEGAGKGLLRTRPNGDDIQLVCFDGNQEVVLLELDVASGAITAPHIGISRPNIVINGNFSVNQRAVSGQVTLAAGGYGHDRWKAGSSGCTYTFETVENVTTITITTGTLVQAVEGLNLTSGAHTLSWTGTAQGKIGDGSFGDSGVSEDVAGGSDLELEFGLGTLAMVKLEKGGTATAFAHASYDEELGKCHRYCQVYNSDLVGINTIFGNGIAESTEAVRGAFHLISPMRTLPTVTLSDVGDFRIFTTGEHKFNSGFGSLQARSRVMCAWLVQSVSGEMIPGQAGQIMAHNTSATITLEAEL